MTAAKASHPQSLRKLRAAATALAVALTLTACSFDIGGIVSDKISEVTGGELDVELGSGPSCLPDWVNYPEGEDSANQGWSSADAEVCVSSWMVPRSTDIAQSLPFAGDESDIGAFVDMLLPLLASQLPGGIGGILLSEANLDQLTDKLDAEGVTFTAYALNEFVLLVLTADGTSDDEMQVVMGVFCQGSC